MVHKYETLSTTNSSTDSFKVKKRPFGTVLKILVKLFLRNRRAQIYEELVNNVLQSYQNLGCNMSEKIHFLHSNLDFFPENCGAVSDEHGERVDQHISSMEKRYQGKWNCAILADYCWTLARDAPTMECERKEKRKKNT